MNTTDYRDSQVYEMYPNYTIQVSEWNISATNSASRRIEPMDSGGSEETMYAYPTPQMVAISATIGLLILCTILGNVFVICAVLLEKSLQTVQNYLILSLAVTDLMVAVLVMPISLVNEISSKWHLGNQICDIWIVFDVLCCTASILHLVAIAGDRYLAVSRIDYIRKRNWQRICIMIAVVWIIAASVSIPPLFGWRDSALAPENTGMCMISQDLGYTLFSTGTAFYFPMSLMLLLNYKIFTTARKRILKRRFLKNSFQKSDERRKGSSKQKSNGHTHYENSSEEKDNLSHENDCLASRDPTYINMNEISRIATVIDTHDLNGSSPQSSPTVKDGAYTFDKGPLAGIKARNSIQAKALLPALRKQRRQAEKEKLKRERLEMRREKKAARVLGIITAAFIACWLPFFIIAVVGPFCGSHCNIPVQLISFFLWLGYFNSLLNPVIYTIFNPHFRTAFNKILAGNYCKVKSFR